MISVKVFKIRFWMTKIAPYIRSLHMTPVGGQKDSNAVLLEEISEDVILIINLSTHCRYLLLWQETKVS